MAGQEDAIGDPSDRWVVGADIRFVVVGPPANRAVPVQLVGDEEDAPALLILRNDVVPAVGSEHQGWVMEPATTPLVTMDSFGRLPISDEMRRRYQKAIAASLGLVGDSVIDTDDLFELKGMFNRVVRRDQRDWASVATVLGSPQRSDLSLWVGRLTNVARQVRSGSAPMAEALMADAGFVDALRRADALLRGRTRTPSATPKSTPQRGRQNPGSEARSEALLRRPETQAMLERANRTHEDVRLALGDELTRRGYHPGADRLLDLYCELPAGLAFYEVKSTTSSNWRAQVRKGVAQLKEYRFLYGQTDRAALYIVLSEPITESWVLDLLVAEYEIGALWRRGAGFAGPAARAALGGGPLRREAGLFRSDGDGARDG
jgi:hypothetical protein